MSSILLCCLSYVEGEKSQSFTSCTYTHCMFLVESNQHYADNNNISIFHHNLIMRSLTHNLRTPLSCHIITYSLFWVSDMNSKSCNYLSNFSIVCKTNCRGKSYDFNTDTKNKQNLTNHTRPLVVRQKQNTDSEIHI